MQHMTALHGSLLHAWGPILSVSALSGVRRRRNALGGFGAAVGEGEELMEIEWTDETGILDAEGAMHADVEELLELANCGAGPQEARCGPGAEARRCMRFACSLTASESCGLPLTSSHLVTCVRLSALVAGDFFSGEMHVCLDWLMHGRWRWTPGAGYTLLERQTVPVWADCGRLDWGHYLASSSPADRGLNCMLQSVRTPASYIDLALADLRPISDRNRSPRLSRARREGRLDCRSQLAEWINVAARGFRRKLSMVSATCRGGQHMTGVLVPRFADTAVRSVLRIHEERLRRQLAEEAGAAAQQAGGGPAQPELAQALIKGVLGTADAGAVV